MGTPGIGPDRRFRAVRGARAARPTVRGAGNRRALLLAAIVVAGLFGVLPGAGIGPAGAAPAGAEPAGAAAHEQTAYPPFTPPVVLVYGDSIVHAAGPALTAMLAPHGIAVVDASVGGTAPCDALQFVAGDMVKYNPDLVVIAYVGNAFSPCINGTPDADVIARHYRDTQSLVAAVDRPVLLATPPGQVGQGRYTSYDILVSYEAKLFGARIADTAGALLDPHSHVFEKTMRCPKADGCDRVAVRGLDGYHLSDAGGYLYAQVLAKAVLAELQPAAARSAGSDPAARAAAGSRRNAGKSAAGKKANGKTASGKTASGKPGKGSV